MPADKFNQSKPKLSLIPPETQEGLARVLEFGLKKYSQWNWQKGLPVIDMIDALKRHAARIEKGELLDKESGLPHADHMQANAMFISWYHHMGRSDWTGLQPHALARIIMRNAWPKNTTLGMKFPDVAPVPEPEPDQ